MKCLPEKCAIKSMAMNSYLFTYSFKRSKPIVPNLEGNSSELLHPRRLDSSPFHAASPENQLQIKLHQIEEKSNDSEKPQTDNKGTLKSSIAFSKAFESKCRRKFSASSNGRKAPQGKNSLLHFPNAGTNLTAKHSHSLMPFSKPGHERRFRFFSAGPTQSEHNFNQIANLELASRYSSLSGSLGKVGRAAKQRTQRLPNSLNELECQKLVAAKFPEAVNNSPFLYGIPNKDISGASTRSIKTCNAASNLVRRIFPVQRLSRRAVRAPPSAGQTPKVFKTPSNRVAREKSVDLATGDFEQLCNVTFGNRLLKNLNSNSPLTVPSLAFKLP